MMPDPDSRPKTTKSSLATTRPLLNWLSTDKAWPNVPLRVRASLSWQAAWGSVNARLARILESQQGIGASTIQDPVLVVGPWRSGTTVMHELLTAATGLATPRSWQCMNAAAFTLTPRRSNRQVIGRPMDGLLISSESPQEDEFALLTLGVPSAYRAFWQPGRLAELTGTLDFDFWNDQPGWLPILEGFLRDVLRTTADPREPLILKSPNHTYRLPAFAQRFPRLRVVWMARPAMQVFHSNRKMWRAMFALHGLASSKVDPVMLDLFLADALSRAADVLLWTMNHLQPAQCVMVPHQRLQADPKQVVLNVREQLGLPASPEPRQYTDALALSLGGRVEQYCDDAVPAYVLAACTRLDDAQALALQNLVTA